MKDKRIWVEMKMTENEYKELRESEEPFSIRKSSLGIINAALLILGILGLITLAILLVRSNTAYVDEKFTSNLTNSSLIKGYVVGYTDCQSELIRLANTSANACTSITFNTTGMIAEFVPRNCLGK